MIDIATEAARLRAAAEAKPMRLPVNRKIDESHHATTPDGLSVWFTIQVSPHARIQEAVRSFSKQGCGLILTTGGTGIGPRDVTPEAIRATMRVEMPGFGEVMRAESMKITPNAILSRNLAAVVDHALVIALPGKPSGAVECLGFVQGAVPHGVALAQETPTSC